ncbi:MAG: hypothetical protein ABI651_09375 [Verrucomicrobiota bacterium]
MKTNTLGATIRGAAILILGTSLVSKTSAQVTISDFDTVRPMTDLTIGDSSWSSPGDTITEAGHQTVGLFTASQAGGGAASFGALNLGANTSLALTASKIDGVSGGVFRVILASGLGFNSTWDFNPSSFPSQSSANTANTGNFGTIELNLAAPDAIGSTGPADLAAITSFTMTGNSGTSIFEARFDNLAAVPEPHPFALVIGVGLLGFGAYKRLRLQQKVVHCGISRRCDSTGESPDSQ